MLWHNPGPAISGENIPLAEIKESSKAEWVEIPPVNYKKKLKFATNKG